MCHRIIGHPLVIALIVGVAVLNTSGCGPADSTSDHTPRQPSPQDAPPETSPSETVAQPAQAGSDATPDAPGETVSPEESHSRMIAALEDVARKATTENTYFNGRSLADQYLSDLKRAIENDDVVGQIEAHKSAGLYLMNVGESARAVEHLEKACDMIAVVEERGAATIPPEAKERLYLQCAVACLRLAEDENCVHCTDGAACVLPIRGKGVHQNREGSEKAVRYFRRVTEINPRNATAVWLWNVAAMTLGEHPDGIPAEYRVPAERFESDREFPEFANIASRLGIDTLSHAGGAIADDFDGDGWIDLVVSNWAPDGQLNFFRNDGDGSFIKQTEAANLIGITGGLNIVHADYDNDGDLDLYVLRGAWLTPDVGSYPNSLLRNDGTGRFTDVTFAVGLGESHHPTQTGAWADYDNDGDLDLYVGNEKTACQLFRNDNGRFVDVAKQAGVDNRLGYAKSVAWGDFDGDRFPDLYVSNMGQENLLFQNQRDGTFREVGSRYGVTDPVDSFASWFWDYNNDGQLDLFVGSYSIGVRFISLDYLGVGQFTEPDRLYQGLGGGKFKEVGKQRGLVAVTQPMGCNFGDLDNDGFLDFYLGTGYPGYDALMPNVMYRNRGGERFDDVTFAGRFGHLQKGHGVAFADLDHDGDQDVFTEMGGAYEGDAFHDALFENPGFGNRWFKVQLVGVRSNRFGVGARIKLVVSKDGQQRTLYRWVNSGSSFGGNPMRQEIGIADADHIERLEVFWPTSQTTDAFDDLDVNQFVEVTEGRPDLRVIPVEAVEFDVD